MSPFEDFRLLGKETNFRVVEELSRRGSPVKLTELATILKINVGTVSRACDDLEGKQLIESKEIKRPEGGKPIRLISAKEKARSLVNAATVFSSVEKAEPLSDPDTEKVDFLLKKLQSDASPEALQTAFDDFGSECRSTRIWELGDKIWKLFDDKLSSEDAGWWVLLKSVILNMHQLGLEDKIGEVMRRFLERVENIWIMGIGSIDPQSQQPIMQVIASLASEEQRIGIYKKTVLHVVKDESLNDVSKVIDLPSLKSLMDFNLKKEQKNRLREWFYDLLEDENQGTRRKTKDFYTSLSLSRPL